MAGSKNYFVLRNDFAHVEAPTFSFTILLRDEYYFLWLETKTKSTIDAPLPCSTCRSNLAVAKPQCAETGEDQMQK